MYYFYVLLSRNDGELYFGYTDNIERRLADHTSGHVASTKDRRPLELLYYESYRFESDARERERQIKRRSKAYVSLKRRLRDSVAKVLEANKAIRPQDCAGNKYLESITLPRRGTVGG